MIFHRNSNQIQRRKQHPKIQSWRQTEVKTLLAIAIWRNTWNACRFARSAGSLPLPTNWYFDAVLEHLSFQFDQKGLCLPHSFLVVWCYMSWSFGFRRQCHWPVNLAKKQQHDVKYRENIERRWQITVLLFWRARSSFVNFGSERHVNMNDLKMERCWVLECATLMSLTI